MSDFRTRYGSAVGPVGLYGPNSGLTLFPQADTTPDVSDGTLFYTNNSGATAISYFDVVGQGGVNGLSEHQGKRIIIFFRDSNTTLVNGAQMLLSQTGGATLANTVVEFLFHNSAWVETNRSQNSQSSDIQTTLVGGTAVTLNAAGARGFLLSPTAATTITGFTNFVPGQRLWIAINPAGGAFAGTAVTIQGGATFMLAGTTAFVMNNSASYDFTAVNGTVVFSQSGLVSP